MKCWQKTRTIFSKEIEPGAAFIKYLACIVALVLASPAFAEASESGADSASYATCVERLQGKFKDEIVAKAFDRAVANPDSFIELVANPMLATHSTKSECAIQEMLASAKRHDWKQTLASGASALQDDKDMPDILLLKALAENKTDHFKESLQDLEYLYNLRHERASGHLRSSDDKNDRKPDAMFATLRHTGKLSDLRKMRAEEYENNYELFNHALYKITATERSGPR